MTDFPRSDQVLTTDDLLAVRDQLGPEPAPPPWGSWSLGGIVIHPEYADLMRRLITTLAVASVLGGRQRDGKRRRSTVAFRDRRASAWRMAQQMWQREARR